MTILKIKDFNVNLDGLHLVQDISLEIDSISTTTIMGANGSGKSTLLNALAGIVTSTYDKFELLGNDIEQMKRAQRAKLLSFMPQRAEIDGNLIIADYFHYCRFPQMESFRPLISKEYQLRDYILESLKISDLLERRVNQVSGGELKKVLIGGAFFQGSSLVLLDEPFQALDPIVKVEVADFIKIISNELKVSTIMACHDLFWAKELSNKVLFLKDGRSLGFGSAESMMTCAKLSSLYGQELSLFKDEETGRETFFPRIRNDQ